jgi:hypothetical protein
MSIQDLIQTRFSGTLNNDAAYMELIVQVFAVLVIGLVLWRLMVLFHKKKNATRKRNSLFDSNYSKQWRNK